jgi:hypothetical protein
MYGSRCSARPRALYTNYLVLVLADAARAKWSGRLPGWFGPLHRKQIQTEPQPQPEPAPLALTLTSPSPSPSPQLVHASYLHRRHGHRLKFVLADPHATADFMRFFGLTAADAPTLVIHDTVREQKHLVKERLGSEAAKRFVNGFLDGGKAAAGATTGIRTRTRYNYGMCLLLDHLIKSLGNISYSTRRSSPVRLVFKRTPRSQSFLSPWRTTRACPEDSVKEGTGPDLLERGRV